MVVRGGLALCARSWGGRPSLLGGAHTLQDAVGGDPHALGLPGGGQQPGGGGLLSVEERAHWQTPSSDLPRGVSAHATDCNKVAKTTECKLSPRQTSNSNLNNFASPTPVNLHGGWIGGRKVHDISGNVWRHSVSVLTIMEVCHIKLLEKSN